MSSKPTLRYGHTEGQTEVCCDDTGEYLISCGRDGEVRIWKGIDDDDPTTVTAGGEAYSVAVNKNIMYVASDNNSVDRYLLPDGAQDGILARFTGNVTHLCVSESRKFVAAGSSDFEIKVMDIQTKKQKCFLGHQAPVLSVAIDPNDEYLASTSCDGKLKLWDMNKETCIQSIDVVAPSNDVGNSSSLARLCWRPATGEDIAVPVDNGVKIYSRVTWSLFQSLTTTVTDKAFHCCSFSPCGRFIAGSSIDGWIVVWDSETQDALRTVRHPLRTPISSLMWNPKENNSLVFSDVRGQVGELKSVVPNDGPNDPKTANELDALFDEEDDNMMVDLMAEEDKDVGNDGDLPKMKRKSKTALFESDDEDDGSAKKQFQDEDFPPIPSTLEVLARDDLDADLAPPSIPPTAPPKLFEDDDASSVATGGGVLPNHRTLPTIMQPPFQPGSTPVHLSHRFMVWNGVGVVRCYNDDTENAIDVEFHDAQTHHSLHVNNQEGYTMADMNDKAVILAGDSSDDRPSKLKCIHFSSWDTNKEWSIGMPDGEEIQCIAIGDCWIATSTDALLVRILSLGGVQRQIFSIPGQVVAMAAHTDQLIIVYHSTQGFGRTQCLGFMLLEVGAGSGCKPRHIIGGQHFPISRDSTLTWLGFTAEGTPGAVDSLGVVRLFNREFCKTWSPVANLKKLTKSRHDHYWVVGLHESPQQIRCVLCKGSSFPSTLPRPTVTVQPFSIPLCDMDGDKAKLEEEYWKTKLFSSSGDYLTSRGYEPDPEGQRKASLEIQHILMRLFALCCKSDHEFQAMEVSSLMPSSSSVQLAVKYASRVRRIALAQRLQEVAQDKLEEEQKEEEEVEDEEDFREEMQAGYSATATEWSPRASQPSATKLNQPCKDDDAPTSEKTEKEKKTKPARSLSSQLAGSRRNPFKKSVDTSSKASGSIVPPGGSVLDEMKRSTPTTMRRTPITSAEVTKRMKGSAQKKATQSTLKVTTAPKINLTSTPKGKKAAMVDDKDDDVIETGVLTEADTNVEKKPMSGVLLFMEEHLQSVRDEDPDVDGIEARKVIINRFRSLPPEKKKEWNERAKLGCGGKPSSGPKRKLEESTNENPSKSQKIEADTPPTNKSKSILSAFAFSENT